MYQIVNPQHARLFDPFDPVLTEKTRKRLLDGWPGERRLMFCDETLVGESGRLPDSPGPWAVLIGPEGGFSDKERARLRGLEGAHPVSLGPRSLRADTAAVAALTLAYACTSSSQVTMRSVS